MKGSDESKTSTTGDPQPLLDYDSEEGSFTSPAFEMKDNERPLLITIAPG